MMIIHIISSITAVVLLGLHLDLPHLLISTNLLHLNSEGTSDSLLYYDLSHFNRGSYPAGFAFGASSSAYQYEGAAFEGGKGPSIWDNFTHQFPGKILDGSNGDIANDFYHLYKEDVKLMKFIGIDAYKMSISWPRILPRGRLSGGVNKEGIAFYNNVINELLANGVTPFVSLFHWDVPQALEDEYNGVLSPLIIDDFRDFVEVCFKEFGDRVKHWITMNEPYIFVTCGYDGGYGGSHAPGRCSSWANCDKGDSATEPYIVAHHMLICHATTVKLYREIYQATQKGEIGITLVTNWMVPFSSSKLDSEAAQRALDFMYGWFAHPLVHGHYPQSMQSLVGNRLPKFSEDQIAMLKGSFDFLGLNYYTGMYAAHLSSRAGNISSTSDSRVHLTPYDDKGELIGDPTGVSIFYVYPKGLYDLLVYTKDKYDNPTIYITENGIGNLNNATFEHEIEDNTRIDFYNQHLHAVREVIDQQGVNVKGFFGWSFLDNFEWTSGYTVGFGLFHVDYKNALKRTPKNSAIWFKNSLQKY